MGRRKKISDAFDDLMQVAEKIKKKVRARNGLWSTAHREMDHLCRYIADIRGGVVDCDLIVVPKKKETLKTRVKPKNAAKTGKNVTQFN